MSVIKKVLDVFEIDAHLVTTCNYSCSYCINEEQRHAIGAQIMTTEMFSKLLDLMETSDASQKIVTMFGGEPTLNNSYIEMANMVLERGFWLDTMTNFHKPKGFFDGIKGPSERVKFSLSYHIEHVDHEDFEHRLGHLVSKGYSINVCMVAPPGRWEDVFQAHAKLQDKFPTVECNFVPDAKSVESPEYQTWVMSKGGLKGIEDSYHSDFSTVVDAPIDIRSRTRLGEVCIVKLSILPNGNVYDCNMLLGSKYTKGNLIDSVDFSRIRVCQNKEHCTNESFPIAEYSAGLK